MEMKQNQIFFHGTSLNLTQYLSFMKKYENISMTLKFEIFSFIIKVSPNNGNELKSDNFPWGIFKSDTISFFIKKY